MPVITVLSMQCKRLITNEQRELHRTQACAQFFLDTSFVLTQMNIASVKTYKA